MIRLPGMPEEKFNPYFPKCFVWELTLKCNLKCLHCGSSAGITRPDELSTAEALLLCDDLKKIRVGSVALMGGEPFLRSDWFLIAEKLNSLNIPMSIISNGVLINDDIIDKLKIIKPGVVGISLDAASSEIHDKMRGVKGSFDKTKDAIFRLKSEGFDVSIITTITSLNIDELPKIRDLILNKGIVWQIQISSSHGARFNNDMMINKEQFYEVGKFISDCKKNYSLEELPLGGADDMGYFSEFLCSPGPKDWKGCSAGKWILGMHSNGNLKPCLSLSDEFIVGNIRKRNLVDLWDDDEVFKFNRNFDKSFLKGNCKDCPHGETCQGGCSDIAFSLTDSPYDNPFCFHLIEKDL